MNKKVEITIKVIGCAIAAGLAVCVGIYAYKHRVVESKCFPVTSTIDAHDYRHPYTTYYKSGSVIVPHTHPAQYHLYYTVEFDDITYKSNCETVSVDYFNTHKDGDRVNAVFEKQWRADGSEDYYIYLNRLENIK